MLVCVSLAFTPAWPSCAHALPSHPPPLLPHPCQVLEFTTKKEQMTQEMWDQR